MPKIKNHVIEKKKDYFNVAVGIIVMILCLLIIGRVGKAGSILALFLSFILGDFSTVILAGVFAYTILFILFKKKIDFHHISFIGCVFLYVAVSMFAHLGLYEALEMSSKTVLSKTLTLYQHYLKAYEITYSCGGGLIAAIFVQISAFLLGKVGTILLGLMFVLIGLSFFSHLDLLRFIKGGKLKVIPIKIYKGIKNYLDNIHYPNLKPTIKTHKKVSLSMLSDHDDQVNFTLQNEIIKERFEDLKRYVRDQKIYCVVDSFYTSYSSSRIVLKFAHKSEEEFRKIAGFFNRQGFFLPLENDYALELPNQFRKLLTLKSVLLAEKKNNELPVALDVDGTLIHLNIEEGRFIVLFGDPSSGIKSCLRSLLVSLLIKGIPYREVYFYDLENEFSTLDGSFIKYINNERSAAIALDEAFEEYERRSEVLKYLDCISIKEANEKIKKSGEAIEPLLPEFHFLYLDVTKVSASLVQKISYAIRFTLKVGIQLILCCRNRNALSKLELNHSDLIVFQTTDVSTSLKLFGSEMACKLQKKGDVLIASKGKVFHGQTPYISIQDFDSIIRNA